MGGGRGRWLLVLAILAGAIFFLDAWRYAGHQLDDSFITFRYARNLVDGHGLVFNPGERVEGYTNLLFVLISAAFIRLGVDPMLGTTIVSGLAGLASLSATGVLCAKVLRSSGGTHFAPANRSADSLLARSSRTRQAEGLDRLAPTGTPERSGEGQTGKAHRGSFQAAGSGQADFEVQGRPWVRVAALLAVGLLLTTEGFAYWSVMSMETMLFTALLVWGLLLLIRGAREGRGGQAAPRARTVGASLLAVPFVLMVLTRPEGAAVSVIAMTLCVVMERRRAGGWGHLRRLAPAAAITAASIAALFAWRFAYYGRLVPNTFHAKVTGDKGQILTGLAYLGDWALASPLLAAALLAPLGLLSRRIRERLGMEHPAGLLWAVAIFIVVTGVVLGGDSMPFFRFFVPAMPLLAVVAATGAATLLWSGAHGTGLEEGAAANGGFDRGRNQGRSEGGDRAASSRVEGVSGERMESATVSHSPGEPGLGTQPGSRGEGLVRWAVIAALLITAIASHATIQPYRAFVAHRTAVVGAAVGKWFAREMASDELMAINTVGSLPWESELPTLDMLGLTDATIASRPVWVASSGWAGHRRGWGAYVMRRRPHAILWYNSAGSTEPFYLGDRELAADPYFRFFYRLRVERLPALDGSRPEGGEQGQASYGEEDGSADPNDDGPTMDRLDEEPRRRKARVGSLRPLARFPGYPFGFHPEGDAVAPELGVRAVFRETPIRHTTFVEHPITVHWFELDSRDAALWPLREKHAGAIEAFVEEVAAEWMETMDLDVPAHDAMTGPAQYAEARLRVEQLCAEAYAAVQAGDFGSAKAILARAANLNRLARVPLVYQYMANVAVVTGDLLAAVPAQKEALRLDPCNALYAQNLARLLRAPFGKVPADAKPPKR